MYIYIYVYTYILLTDQITKPCLHVLRIMILLGYTENRNMKSSQAQAAWKKAPGEMGPKWDRHGCASTVRISPVISILNV